MDAIAFTKNGIEFIKHTKPQKNSRFKKLQKRAEEIGFWMERVECSYCNYEIGSNERDQGITYCCKNLNEVEEEIIYLEKKWDKK